MATIKKSKANLSAGPGKMTKRAGPVDPKGKWTSVQERTLGNMKKGGKLKKAQGGIMFPGGIKKTSSTTQSPISKGPYKIQKNVPSGDQLRKDWQSKEREMTTKTPNSKTVKPLKAGGSISKAQAGKTVKQSNADMMKAIEAREKRIAARDSANQRKSYTNERANKVVGKNKMGGMIKKCMTGCK